MSMIYNTAYRVSSWVVVNLPKDSAKIITAAFSALGAHEIKWLSNSFINTIQGLSKRGWASEVSKERPFIVNQDFMNVAITAHLKNYGENKTMSGTPDKPWSAINRNITCDEDYARIFDEVMAGEPDITLSHIFSIGELCHRNGEEQVKTFVTIGPVAKKALQKVSDRVITIGGASDDVDLTGIAPEKIGLIAIEYVAGQLGFIK